MNDRTPPAFLVPAPSEPRAIAPEAAHEAAAAVSAGESPQAPPPLATSTELAAAPPARLRLDPTRYGDWELNGKCVDF